MYDKVNQKLLSLQNKYIDFVDSSLKTSTSCIISNEYGSWGMFGYKNAAIVSQPRDVLDLHWYKQLLSIGKSRTHIIAKDSFDRYGIIDDHNNILLNFVYQEIKPLEVGEEVYIICKEGKYYGILNKELKVIVPCFLLELEDYSRLKLITYKNEQGSSFAMDLTTLNECKLPDNFNRIDDYKEGILTFEIAEEQYRFFNLEKKCYINSYIYQKVSEDEEIIINKSFVLCRRNNTNILVSIDGTEYPIKFEGNLSQYGETVIGVTPIEEKYIGQYGFECTRTNYDVSVFRKNILLSKFTHKESSVYHETFDLVSEDVIWVWHWGKYGKFGTRINLKGEHVSSLKTEVSAISKKTTEENTRLIKIVKEKFLNSIYIANFDSFIEDEWNSFNIQVLGSLAFVSYNWNAGDDEGHCGTVVIGYADENMCYWAKDCMINQI
ncbi:WG repeat-containing protein [Prevotella sp. E9-3]|uniref:WG repeat-containing protein n=1 Tax=Prevotella sp. E9-3 TaxID=2913621 RepID=UPI001EDB7A45|nr:WG repeat-containing protein [Prevotella sp. E9-3]UKK47379.1 WG repeat-containing protein [Prevotella sp. E9-3]